MTKTTLSFAIAALLSTSVYAGGQQQGGGDSTAASKSISNSTSNSASRSNVESTIGVNTSQSQGLVSSNRSGDSSATVGNVTLQANDGRDYSDIPWYGWLGTSSSPNPGNNTAFGRNSESIALPLVGGGYSWTEDDEFSRALYAIEVGKKYNRNDVIELGFESLINEVKGDIEHNQQPEERRRTRATSVSKSTSSSSSSSSATSLDQFGS